MITENNCDAHVDETVLEYEETLSDLAVATRSYSSTEVVPKTEVLRDREIETNVPDSAVIAETKIVSETQEETRNAPARNLTREELLPNHIFKQ